MSDDNERMDAVVHKRKDIPVQKFGVDIDLRRVGMSTVAQTWIEMKQGHFSPLHRHEDEQTVVLISGKLRARSGPNDDEIYTEMEPGDILTVLGTSFPLLLFAIPASPIRHSRFSYSSFPLLLFVIPA